MNVMIVPSIVLAAEHLRFRRLHVLFGLEGLRELGVQRFFARVGPLEEHGEVVAFFSATIRSRSCSSVGGAADLALRPGPSRNRAGGARFEAG
jgi:hypothetical protein